MKILGDDIMKNLKTIGEVVAVVGGIALTVNGVVNTIKNSNQSDIRGYDRKYISSNSKSSRAFNYYY